MEQILEFIKQYKKNKSAVVGFIIVVMLLLTAIFAPLIAPYLPDNQDLANRLIPPIWDVKGVSGHILGTDDFGRDLFSRVIFGSRISLMVGAISVGISLSFGLLMGIFAAYFGKKTDLIIMRIVDIMLAIPAILLAIVIVSILGPSLFSAMTAIGIVGIPVYARIVRSSVLAEREKEYVVASRINGSSNLRLMFKVILPNCASPIIVQATMGFASAVLEAAGLSFLGLGAQPPTPEWGSMLSNSLEFITTAPWMIFYPGLAIFLTVLSFNLMGDGLMDVLDPKLKDK
ncbi:MAG: ABC transporter permease subunit [Epsilonproteobacteria bacterium]|nr:ABC transporter permease subunit [Campylobacterota bacterium]